MERTNLLQRPYSAYDRKEVGPDSEVLKVGKGTAGGEYLRRFWQPFAFTSEFTDVPMAVRILSEDLVAFKDGQGNYGLLERRCSHRGASLEFGKVQERGMRCCYHGWHFDVDGRILDIPGDSSGLKNRICQGAYPVHEYKGLLFAYMGPPDKKPAFPLYDVLEREPGTQFRRKDVAPCNWLQIRENETDPMHISQLHCGLFGIQFTEVFSQIPVGLQWFETSIGVMYAGTFRWKDKVYVRTNDLIMPNLTRVAGIEDAEGEVFNDIRGGSTNWVVPIDDYNSMTIGWRDIEPEVEIPGAAAYLDRQRKGGAEVLSTAGNIDTQTGNRSYQERQRAPGDWDAFVSQGPMTIHGREHLVASDRGVIMFRKMLKAGMEAVQAGKDPFGVVLADQARSVIRTHARNTVLSIPKATSEREDKDACGRVARWYVDALREHRFENDTQPSAKRLDEIREQAVKVFNGEKIAAA
ncbi:hypothetical protein XH84_10655 [Bradyrhizobium nanningense]|uniref:aromatic ring-hydroxylating dioxygenase subunit alpha n=1 Tax=Bradyrhizobium nanningense TaxID=1325118 RepID=UPI001008AEC0|nr:aromatic ring-hydroxylating dioxygenase subunit alpha [Bradyrhizobium nanningense]RXH33389.1 hypothetical protein XH84_10655 [Bradyrhizobium nanningense]